MKADQSIDWQRVVLSKPISVDVETPEGLYTESTLAVIAFKEGSQWYDQGFDFSDEQQLNQFKEIYQNASIVGHNLPYDVFCLWQDFKILPKRIVYDTYFGNHCKALAKVAEFLQNPEPIYSFKTKPKSLSMMEYCRYHARNTYSIWVEMNLRAVIKDPFDKLFPFACIVAPGFKKDDQFLQILQKDLFDFAGEKFDYNSNEERVRVATKLGIPLMDKGEKKTCPKSIILPGKNFLFDAMYQIFKLERGIKDGVEFDFFYTGNTLEPTLHLKINNSVPPMLQQGQFAVWNNWVKFIKLLELLGEKVDPMAPVIGDYRDWYCKCYTALGTSGRSLARFFRQAPQKSWETWVALLEQSEFKKLAKWMKSCKTGEMYKEIFKSIYRHTLDDHWNLVWLTLIQKAYPNCLGASSWVTLFQQPDAFLKEYLKYHHMSLLTVHGGSGDDTERWLVYSA